MKFLIAFLSNALALVVLANAQASNPLKFREYTQTVTLRFATSEEAHRAELTVRPLPERYKLALSARWDDSASEHLNTLAVMKKHNIKGTFFQNDPKWALHNDPEYLQKLQTGGCSLGLHTIHHPQLPTLDSYSHFREYMQNRIMIETLAQCAVNAQVLPFCSWWEPVPEIPDSIGWAMRATGVISSPDVMIHSRELPELGYPAGSHAFSHLLTPGDRVPDLNRFREQLKQILGNAERLDENPAVSMSMHSWHTPEGLQKLDEIFAELAKNPDWWYCNQTEYGAYRYEARNTSVSKKTDGSEAHFTIRRIEPAESGAELPLYFTVKNAIPLSATGAELQTDLLKLPHDANHKLPEEFDWADADGKSGRFPGIKLQLRHDTPTRFTARIENRSNVPLEECFLTFRFPAVCGRETERREIPRVEPGGTATVTVELPKRLQEIYYRYGRPYYALQMDFRKENRFLRLFADLEEPAENDLPLTPDAAAVICEMPPDANLAALSNPAVDSSSILQPSINAKKRTDLGPCSIHPELNRKNWPSQRPYLAILEFKPRQPGDLTLYSRLFERWQNCELWHNGKKVGKNNERHVVLSPSPGVNRLLFKAPANHFLTVRIEPAVDYLPTSQAEKKQKKGEKNMNLSKTMTLLPILGAALTLGAGDAKLLVDINSKQNQNSVKVVPTKGQSSNYAIWEKDPVAQKQYCVMRTDKPIGEEWQKVSFSFVPEKSGTLFLSYGCDNKAQDWLLIDKIELNGKVLNNGDFAKAAYTDGKLNVPGFWGDAQVKIVEKAGSDGTFALGVSSKKRFGNGITVEAGKTCTLTITLKAIQVKE